MVLVHAAPSTLEPYRSKHLGVLSSPRRFYGESENVESWDWAADNDAYSNWNADRYRRMLEAIWGLKGCLFVTAPDVVGDANRTLELFNQWYDDLTAVLQPLALVAQDGLTSEMVPWSAIDALFIGGSDLFKMGAGAEALVSEARLRGKWVHMGRVNTQQRMRYAKAIRCDSIDGTSLSWFRDTYLPSVLAHAAQPRQMLISSNTDWAEGGLPHGEHPYDYGYGDAHDLLPCGHLSSDLTSGDHSTFCAVCAVAPEAANSQPGTSA